MAMASLVRSLCMFLFMSTAAYEFVDPNVTKTYCLNSKQPLLFEDPFPTSVQGERFVQMNWVYRPFDKKGVRQPQKVLFSLKIPKLEAVVKDPRFKKYQHWGLSLENPKPEDAGIYRAILALFGAYKNEFDTTNVIMSSAPTLKTSRLAESRSSNNQIGEITLHCGTVASLGTPSAQLIWRNPNGTVIDAVYKDGNITLVLGSDKATGTYTCQVTEKSLAFQCVPPAEVPLWKGKFNFDGETMYFSEFNIKIMIIVIIMCVIVAIVLAIIGIVMLQKKGQKNNFRLDSSEPSTSQSSST